MPEGSLSDALIQTALDHSDHPAAAVASLMRAAAAILERTLGPAEAIRLLRQMVNGSADQFALMQGRPPTMVQ